MLEPKAWECPRCHRINAPHIDHCDCYEEGRETTAAPDTPLEPFTYGGKVPIIIYQPTPDYLRPPYTITCGASFTDARSPDYTAQFPNVRH